MFAILRNCAIEKLLGRKKLRKVNFYFNLLRRGELDLYDLYNKKCSKGSEVKAVIEYLGIDI